MKGFNMIKCTMIVSWLLCFAAVTIWGAIHYYFYQLGCQTDEDWFESGLTFSVWGNINLICTLIGLFSPFVALITTTIYTVEKYKNKA